MLRHLSIGEEGVVVIVVVLGAALVRVAQSVAVRQGQEGLREGGSNTVRCSAVQSVGRVQLKTQCKTRRKKRELTLIFREIILLQIQQ